jgi:hypothetical protein
MTVTVESTDIEISEFSILAIFASYWACSLVILSWELGKMKSLGYLRVWI